MTTDSDATLLRIDGEAPLEALQAVPAMRPALDAGGRGRGDRGTSASVRSAGPLDGPAGIDGATVVVVSAGYPGNHRIYERMAQSARGS